MEKYYVFDNVEDELITSTDNLDRAKHEALSFAEFHEYTDPDDVIILTPVYTLRPPKVTMEVVAVEQKGA